MDQPETKIVHVLTYSHKHGSDVSVYATHDAAVLSLYEIVMELIGDVEDEGTRKNIREAVKARDLSTVSQLWAETMEEGFDIDACDVINDESSSDLDAAIKASEEDDAAFQDAFEENCEECGETITRDSSEGVWVHGDATREDKDHDADENHVARPPEGTVW